MGQTDVSLHQAGHANSPRVPATLERGLPSGEGTALSRSSQGGESTWGRPQTLVTLPQTPPPAPLPPPHGHLSAVPLQPGGSDAGQMNGFVVPGVQLHHDGVGVQHLHHLGRETAQR